MAANWTKQSCSENYLLQNSLLFFIQWARLCTENGEFGVEKINVGSSKTEINFKIVITRFPYVYCLLSYTVRKVLIPQSLAVINVYSELF